MPVLDAFKAALTDHMVTLVKSMTLGSSGGQASTRDGGVGNAQLSVTPEVTRLDDRTISVSGVFGTGLTSERDIKEGCCTETLRLTPPPLGPFIPIAKGSTTEMRVDVVLEVR